MTVEVQQQNSCLL